VAIDRSSVTEFAAVTETFSDSTVTFPPSAIARSRAEKRMAPLIPCESPEIYLVMGRVFALLPMVWRVWIFALFTLYLVVWSAMFSAGYPVF
jgi:hypothetical protein